MTYLVGFAILIIISLSLTESFAISIAKPHPLFGRSPILAFKEIAILMTKGNNPLNLNVGFVVNADAGFERVFEFDLPKVFVPPETELIDLRGKASIGRTPQGLIAKVDISAETKSEC